MRTLLLAAIFGSVLPASPGLEIIKPVVSEMEGGAPVAAGLAHTPGEIVYFWCRVGGFVRTEDEKVHVTYSVQAFDSKGVPLDEAYKNEVKVDVGPNDKDWMPKIATTIAIPPMAASGEYKIVIKAQDVAGKTATELAVPFRVRGKDVAPSETVIVRNFQFHRSEDGSQPLAKAVYHPGDTVWAQFDIIGFHYGERNKMNVSYTTSVVTAAGKVLWTQPEPATDESEAFYPKRFVSASMSISLQTNFKPGEYAIGVLVKDTVGGQVFQIQYPFVVE